MKERKITVFFDISFTGLLLQRNNIHLKPGAGKILQDLKKLNVLGNVLYLAAHPDENTTLIAYMANENYIPNWLSLVSTREMVDKNLIGSEIGRNLELYVHRIVTSS
jgi:hypothetical protein